MKFYFISQVYPPDPAAVGQYFEDAALALAQRGHEVVVLTADRDYDDPSILYDSASRHENISVVRMWRSSFGKKTILHRLLGQASYLFQCFCWLLVRPKPDALVLTTIPATTGVLFLPIHWLKRFRYLYWVMDINPDQAVALGAFSANSIFARALRWANEKLVAGARSVVCLDDEMKERLATNRPVDVLPPWPLENDQAPVEKKENPFLQEHDLIGDFVFMYSGNHSLVHPLDTLFDAILQAELSSNVKFLFVGGGRGKEKVKSLVKEATNVYSLPYQPLDRIRFSLSAADIHVVSMGDSMRGIVHPCKLYSAMAVGKPILFLGNTDSVLGQVVSSHGIGWCVPHGNVEEMVKTLSAIEKTSSEELVRMGDAALRLSRNEFSSKRLCGSFCDILEQSVSDGK